MINAFLICPPKLEKILLQELKEKFIHHFPESALEILETVPGGVEISCSISEALLLNRILRGATRILIRIKRQKCRDLPKLYNILKKIDWKDYINSEEVKFHVSSHKSRVRIEKKIQSSAQSAIQDYFKGSPLKQSVIDKYSNSPENNVYLRFYEDELTVSLDTSGDLLHIRGDRSFRGHASLRENTASLLLRYLFEGVGEIDHLIDPMCGTGTFLVEKMKEGELLDRDFQFQCFKESLVSALPELEPMNTKEVRCIGFDIDAEIVKKNNFEGVEFATRDLFENQEKIAGKNVVVCNPPFGKRVKIAGDKIEFFERIFNQTRKLYSPVRIGMIIPRDFVGKLPGDRLYFNLNGIEVCFLRWSNEN